MAVDRDVSGGGMNERTADLIVCAILAVLGIAWIASNVATVTHCAEIGKQATTVLFTECR
jgi:hypothetical protein